MDLGDSNPDEQGELSTPLGDPLERVEKETREGGSHQNTSWGSFAIVSLADVELMEEQLEDPESGGQDLTEPQIRGVTVAPVTLEPLGDVCPYIELNLGPTDKEEKKVKALVDTGAAVSVWPVETLPSGVEIRPDSSRLQTASGAQLFHDGVVTIRLDIPIYDTVGEENRPTGVYTLHHDFFAAHGVQIPLMGADLLSTKALSVDFRTAALVLPDGLGRIPFKATESQSMPCRAVRKWRTVLASEQLRLQPEQKGWMTCVLPGGESELGSWIDFVLWDDSPLEMLNVTPMFMGEPKINVLVKNKTCFDCYIYTNERVGEWIGLSEGPMEPPASTEVEEIHTVKQLVRTIAREQLSRDRKSELSKFDEYLQTQKREERKLDQELWGKTDPSVWEGARGKALQTLIIEFPNLFYKSVQPLPRCTEVEFKIELKHGYIPAYRTHGRTSMKMREALQKEIEEMCRLGIIEPCDHSFWSNPIMMVKKPDGSWRMVNDFKGLNNWTIRDGFTVYNVKDILFDLQGMRIFSKFDLKHAYWCIVLDEKSRNLTAFTVPGMGCWRYCRCPQGVVNAPATFCRLMQKILGPISVLRIGGKVVSKVFGYMDDILLASETEHDHMEHMRMIFETLQRAGLTMSAKKYEFFKDSLTFLGHVITKDGIKPDPGKIEVIVKWPTPKTRREIRRFLGLVNYYRMFIEFISEKTRNLRALNTDEMEKSGMFEWKQEHQEEFDVLKRIVSSAPILVQPLFDRPFIIHSDACKWGIGFILQQMQDDGMIRPIEFGGRVTSPSEAKYSTSELECLALYSGLKAFRVYIEGMKVLCKTDHIALKTLLSKRESPNPRLQAWAYLIGIYFPQVEIEYEPGKDIPHADAISRQYMPVDSEPEHELADLARPDSESAPGELPAEEIRQITIVGTIEATAFRKRLCEAQGTDPWISIIREKCIERGTSGRTPGIRILSTDFALVEDVVYKCNGGIYKAVAPTSMRTEIMTRYHSAPWAAHGGAIVTWNRIRAMWYWPAQFRDITTFVRRCTVCAAATKLQPRKGPKLRGGTHATSMEFTAFSRVMMDFAGPIGGMETKRGNRYILVFVDLTTRWVEAVAESQCTAQQAAIALVEQVILRHGMPMEVRSDRGTHFMADMMREVCAMMGIEQMSSTANSSHTQGAVERVIGTLKQSLRAMMENNRKDWDENLPYVLAAYRASIHRATGFSPFELLYGRQFVFPTELRVTPAQTAGTHSIAERLEVVIEQAKNRERKAREKDPTHGEDNQLNVGDVVRIRDYEARAMQPLFSEDLWVVASSPFSNAVMLKSVAGDVLMTVSVKDVKRQEKSDLSGEPSGEQLVKGGEGDEMDTAEDP